MVYLQIISIITKLCNNILLILKRNDITLASLRITGQWTCYIELMTLYWYFLILQRNEMILSSLAWESVSMNDDHFTGQGFDKVLSHEICNMTENWRIKLNELWPCDKQCHLNVQGVIILCITIFFE